MRDQHHRPLRPDNGVDKAPQEIAMRRKAVGEGAGIVELVAIAHADQVRRDAMPEPRHLRHDIAPEIGRGRVAVQEQKHRLALAQFDIGHSLTPDRGKALGERLGAEGHEGSPGGVGAALGPCYSPNGPGAAKSPDPCGGVALTGRGEAGSLDRGVRTASIADPRDIRAPAALSAADRSGLQGPELCVVVPTFNERDNVDVLVERLDRTLRDVAWEVVFVDDDSPDGTAEHIRALGEHDPRIRCIRRVGRRGLSSACIEGMLATSAPLVAIIDADLQHDEALLPRMRDALTEDAADVVIASRYIESGSPEGLSSDRRKRLSLYGARLARRLIEADVADSVSGFFMLRRALVDEVAA